MACFIISMHTVNCTVLVMVIRWGGGTYFDLNNYICNKNYIINYVVNKSGYDDLMIPALLELDLQSGPSFHFLGDKFEMAP